MKELKSIFIDNITYVNDEEERDRYDIEKFDYVSSPELSTDKRRNSKFHSVTQNVVELNEYKKRIV